VDDDDDNDDDNGDDSDKDNDKDHDKDDDDNDDKDDDDNDNDKEEDNLPSLLPPSPLPSSLHATLVATAILLVVALALFVAHHPHCRHHRPCHPCPLCCCHHHPPHAIVVRRRPPSWSCGRLVNALSPATTRLCRSRRWLIVVCLLLPLPSLPLLARHPCRHRSCCRCHRPLHCTPPLLPPPFFSLSPLPSSLPTTLIAVTIALATLALFVAAIIIRRTLLLFVIAHRLGCVVASSTLSRQPPPAFVNPIAG
jgi:hypothetical protein